MRASQGAIRYRPRARPGVNYIAMASAVSNQKAAPVQQGIAKLLDEFRADSSPVAANAPLEVQQYRAFCLLALGRSNQEIAETLVLSIGTVKSHTNSIYRKLGARNRAEASARARALALV